jgi:hypothetical protein
VQNAGLRGVVVPQAAVGVGASPVGLRVGLCIQSFHAQKESIRLASSLGVLLCAFTMPIHWRYTRPLSPECFTYEMNEPIITTQFYFLIHPLSYTVHSIGPNEPNANELLEISSEFSLITFIPLSKRILEIITLIHRSGSSYGMGKRDDKGERLLLFEDKIPLYKTKFSLLVTTELTPFSEKLPSAKAHTQNNS